MEHIYEVVGYYSYTKLSPKLFWHKDKAISYAKNELRKPALQRKTFFIHEIRISEAKTIMKIYPDRLFKTKLIYENLDKGE